MPPQNATRMRLERLADLRQQANEQIEDTLRAAEEERRELNDFENEHLGRLRERQSTLETEIVELADDLERAERSRDVSALLRPPSHESDDGDGGTGGNGRVVYRTFAAYARDEILVRHPQVAAIAARERGEMGRVVEQARTRLERAVAHTLTTDVEGLLPPQHLNQILDIINMSRPVVNAGARRVDLSSGKLTYPSIAQRPAVAKQATEKTEAGNQNMQVDLNEIRADTYLGGGNLSWQTINWSSPDALQLWFDLAAEAYARETEIAACAELGSAAGGTIGSPLGTTGTESFAAWRAAAIAAISSIYTQTAGRAQTGVLYLAAQRFFQLAGLGTDQTLQVSPVGSLDIASMTGTWSGLRVVGSYGFANPNTAIVGDAGAFLVGETPGAPVELRAVEPAIGGMEVGVIGAFKSKVYDPDRFTHLS